MFTGIVEEIGIVNRISSQSDGVILSIEADKVLDDLKLGDSVAVNGVCLTAIDIKSDAFSADVSFETLSRSNIGSLKRNDVVNLERALKVSDRLSGHIVLGHVDSKALVSNIQKRGNFYILKIVIDPYIYRHCVKKGSIAIDGISLTISDLNSSFLEVAVIPHTFENTNLKYKKSSDYVNIEVDVLGKYVEKFFKKGPIDEEFLSENGFI